MKPPVLTPDTSHFTNIWNLAEARLATHPPVSPLPYSPYNLGHQRTFLIDPNSTSWLRSPWWLQVDTPFADITIAEFGSANPFRELLALKVRPAFLTIGPRGTEADVSMTDDGQTFPQKWYVTATRQHDGRQPDASRKPPCHFAEACHVTR